MIIMNPLAYKAYDEGEGGGGVTPPSFDFGEIPVSVSPQTITYGQDTTLEVTLDCSSLDSDKATEMQTNNQLELLIVMADLHYNNWIEITDQNIGYQTVDDSIIVSFNADTLRDLYDAEFGVGITNNQFIFCVMYRVRESSTDAWGNYQHFDGQSVQYIPQEEETDIQLESITISTNKNSYDFNTDTSMQVSLTLIPSNATYSSLIWQIGYYTENESGWTTISRLENSLNGTITFATDIGSWNSQNQNIDRIRVRVQATGTANNSTMIFYSEYLSVTPISGGGGGQASTEQTIQQHKSTWRGQNLFDYFDTVDDLVEAVQAGNFEDIWVGDYIPVSSFSTYTITDKGYSWSGMPTEISDITFRVVDINYKPSSLGEHNLIFVPNKCLLNTPRTFSQDWLNDNQLRGWIDFQIVEELNVVFNNHLVGYDDDISVSNYGPYERYGADLMTEDSMFGSSQSHSVYPMTTIFTTQFAGFAANPDFQTEIIIPPEIVGDTTFNTWIWLRDVNSSGYPLIAMQGNQSSAIPTSFEGMYFGVCPFVVFG